MKPVTFIENVDFYKDLAGRYATHKRGLFILTPSGAGKTYYCRKQENKEWIDGDDLWVEAKAQPDPLEYQWWEKGGEIINQVEQRCDAITAEAMVRGFWVMGSVNYAFKPDAIVLPKLDALMKRIQQREQEGYDGGLKSEHLEQLITHIGIIRDWRIKYGVPEFETIQEAVDFLTKDLKKL